MYSKTCLSCINLHIHGYGYSDWTWKGNELNCTQNLFLCFEDTYEKPTQVHVCPSFQKGKPFETSPDGNVCDGEQLLKCKNCEGSYYA